MVQVNRLFKYLSPSEIQYIAPHRDESEDEIAFSNSIKENGVIEPLIVSVNKSGNKYQLIAGARRLFYAKRHQLHDVPCIIWKDTQDSDVALAQFIEIAHKRTYSDKEKAHAIGLVYESIGISPSKSIQIVHKLHNEGREDGNARAKLENIKSKFGKPTPKFMNLFKKIGYSAVMQYRFLSLITNLEPEVLDYAEKKELKLEQKILLSHSQLDKELKAKAPNKETAVEYKKHLANQIAGKRKSESQDIVHRAIDDVRDDVINLKTWEVRDELRKEAKERLVTEGEGGATIAFLAATDAIHKILTVLTQGKLKLEKGETTYDDIPKERIVRTIKTYTLEIIKTMEDSQVRSLRAHIQIMNTLTNELLGILEDEEQTRRKKRDMIQR